jgi:hypothetical protein
MTSISMAAVAAKNRVNRPRMSAMPAAVSLIVEVQYQNAGGLKP